METNLLGLVAEYSDFGFHRTGSKTEIKTRQWLYKHLVCSGARVDYHQYTYLHYQSGSRVFIKDRAVPSLPLYYEATGVIHQTQNVETASIEITGDEGSDYSAILEIAKFAKRHGRDAAIIATKCENESLHALNVTPTPKNNLPVVLIPGIEARKLSPGKVTLEFNASVKTKTNQNIVARYVNQAMKDSVVITTPVTGWFSCAGERGTGIALAINLAKELSTSQSVSLVLTSGHELGYLGGFEYANALASAPRGVIHIGSCIGTPNADIGLWTNLSPDFAKSMNKLLPLLGTRAETITKPLEATNWVGESQCWALFGCPMISVAGSNPLFHTPEDRAPVATSRERLENAFDELLDLGKYFLRYCIPDCGYRIANQKIDMM